MNTSLSSPGRPPGKTFEHVKSIRFTRRDMQRIQRLAEKLEVTDADAVRLAIRELAKKERVE